MLLRIFLYLVTLLLMPVIVWAQEAAVPETNIGQYSLPVILSVLLGLVYKIFNLVEDRWKSLVAIVLGIGLGYLSLLYSGAPLTIPFIIQYGLFGLMSGAAAVGLYEAQRSVLKPR